jgi:mRNA-degrading endonuclease toxin of MazEF toxin-antitoxin module
VGRPDRGDIYHIEIAKSEIIGRELYGPHWWVVVSLSAKNTQVFSAVPLSSPTNKVTGEQKDRGDFRYFNIRVTSNAKTPEPEYRQAKVFNGDSIALTDQLRVFAVERLTGPRAGVVTKDGLGAIESGIMFVIDVGIRRQTADQNTLAISSQKQSQRPLSVVKEESRPVPGPPPKAN